MGWLGLDEPQHIETYLNQLLYDFNAVAVAEVEAEHFTNWVSEQLAEPGFYNPYGVWYVGTLHAGTEKEREYIGLILVDFDHERSNGSISLFEQAWRYKVLSAMDGPNKYDCPLEYLDRVLCDTSSEFEAKWRQKVRAHHAAL